MEFRNEFNSWKTEYSKDYISDHREKWNIRERIFIMLKWARPL